MNTMMITRNSKTKGLPRNDLRKHDPVILGRILFYIMSPLQKGSPSHHILLLSNFLR